MERENFREALRRGTTAFPVAIYNIYLFGCVRS